MKSFFHAGVRRRFSSIVLLTVLPASAAIAAAPLASPTCQTLFQKRLAKSSVPRIVIADLHAELNTSGTTTLDLGFTIDRDQLYEIFASHPYFSVPASSKKNAITFRKDLGWQPSSSIQAKLASFPYAFPEHVRQIGLGIGRRIEAKLRRALPAEEIEFSDLNLTWYNPQIPLTGSEHPTGKVDQFAPHADGIYLNAALAVYGDGTLSWGPVRYEPGRTAETATKTPTGALYILSGSSRQQAYPAKIIATQHSSPHTTLETERLIFFFIFRSKLRSP